MRTSPAVPGVSAEVGGSGEAKKVFEITWRGVGKCS